MKEAIDFARKHFSKYNKSSKPVLKHSINVGRKLSKLNYPIETVRVGILHDVIEDSNCKISEIESKFGEKVAHLVSALSYNSNITDPIERHRDLIQRIVKAGKEAMIIKVIDNMDNLPYVDKIKDLKKRNLVIKKHLFTIKSFERFLKDDPMFRKYKSKVNLFQDPEITTCRIYENNGGDN